ncbi:MAG: FmdB family zinc ribbon protein [Acidobacteriota bacterium]
MPLFEYQCSHCSYRYERLQKRTTRTAPCPQCGSTGKRLLSAPAIRFKGSGWYVTDYAKNKAGGGDPGKEKAAAKDGAREKPAAKKKNGGAGREGRGQKAGGSTDKD